MVFLKHGTALTTTASSPKPSPTGDRVEMKIKKNLSKPRQGDHFLSDLRLALIIFCLFVILYNPILHYYVKAQAVTTVTLVSGGSPWRDGVVFSFGSSDASKATLGGASADIDLVTDRITSDTDGNLVIDADTTSPGYILRFPYLYSTSTQRITVYPRTADLDIRTTTFAQGVKVYGLTGTYITAVPTYDPTAYRLTVSAAAASGVLYIYTGTMGKPIRVIVDGAEKVEGTGWSVNSVTNVVTINPAGLTNIVDWTGSAGQAASTSSSSGSGGPSATTTTETAPTIPLAPTTPDTGAVFTAPPSTITAGSAVIIAIIGIALVADNIRKSLSPAGRWAKQAKNIHKKRPKWRKTKWLWT